MLLLILWSKGGLTEHDSVLPLLISSLIVFWFDKLMCRSLAFPSYEGSVWHDMDKRPSSCWVSFLRGGEASHSPGALPGPLEHRVQNSDLDLKWSRGRITVGRSCPYAGCQCAEGRQSLVCLGERGHIQDSCPSHSAKVVGKAEHCYLMHLKREGNQQCNQGIMS